MVTDHMYGELNYSVIDGYLYKDEEIDGSTDGYADRGIDKEVSIIFVNNNEKNVIIMSETNQKKHITLSN